MSNQQPEENKLRGIMKQEDNSEKRLPRKSISFKNIDQVVVYHDSSRYKQFKFSPTKPTEHTRQTAEEEGSGSLGAISNSANWPTHQADADGSKRNMAASGSNIPKQEGLTEREQFANTTVPLDDVPDRNDEIRRRLENISRRRSVAANLNPNLPLPAVLQPQREEPQMKAQPQPGPAQPTGRRLSDAFKRGLRQQRLTMDDEESRKIQKEIQDLDDCPSNNKRRMDQMKSSMSTKQMVKSRQTKGLDELYSMFECYSDEKPKSPKEQHKSRQPSRITIGLKDVERLVMEEGLEGSNNDYSFEQSPNFKRTNSPSFKKPVNPILNKYIDGSVIKGSEQKFSETKAISGEMDYSQKRLKVIAFLEEMKNKQSSMLDSKSPRNKELQTKREALTNKLAALRQREAAAERKSKFLSDSIRTSKAELMNLQQHADINRELKLLLGASHLCAYSKEQLKEADTNNGEDFEYYVELAFDHEIYIKIKKKLSKEPDMRISNSLISDQQTDVLCAKAIASIIKNTFSRNCSNKEMFDTIVFLSNQYAALKKLQEQLNFISQLTDVRTVTLSNTQDRLVIVGNSRRNEGEFEIRIELGDGCWWQHVKASMVGYQEQVDMLQSNCRRTTNYLTDLVLLLSHKLV